MIAKYCELEENILKWHKAHLAFEKMDKQKKCSHEKSTGQFWSGGVSAFEKYRSTVFIWLEFNTSLIIKPQKLYKQTNLKLEWN